MNSTAPLPPINAKLYHSPTKISTAKKFNCFKSIIFKSIIQLVEANIIKSNFQVDELFYSM